MSDGFLDERRPAEIEAAIRNLWAVESIDERFHNYGYKGERYEYALSVKDRCLTPTQLVEERLAVVDRQLRILDLGAGACMPLVHLREVFGDQVDLVAVSAHPPRVFSQESQSAIEESKIDFRTGNAEFWKSLVDPSENFDIVFSRYGIRWFCDPLAAIERILSQLSQGGIFWADPVRIPSNRGTFSRLLAKLDAVAIPQVMSHVDGDSLIKNFYVTKTSDSKEPIFTDFQYDVTVPLDSILMSLRVNNNQRRQASYTTTNAL